VAVGWSLAVGAGGSACHTRQGRGQLDARPRVPAATISAAVVLTTRARASLPEAGWGVHHFCPRHNACLLQTVPRHTATCPDLVLTATTACLRTSLYHCRQCCIVLTVTPRSDYTCPALVLPATTVYSL